MENHIKRHLEIPLNQLRFQLQIQLSKRKHLGYKIKDLEEELGCSVEMYYDFLTKQLVEEDLDWNGYLKVWDIVWINKWINGGEFHYLNTKPQHILT